MAVTADQVMVRLLADSTQYQQQLRAAEQAALASATAETKRARAQLTAVQADKSASTAQLESAKNKLASARASEANLRALQAESAAQIKAASAAEMAASAALSSQRQQETSMMSNFRSIMNAQRQVETASTRTMDSFAAGVQRGVARASTSLLGLREGMKGIGFGAVVMSDEVDQALTEMSSKAAQAATRFQNAVSKIALSGPSGPAAGGLSMGAGAAPGFSGIGAAAAAADKEVSKFNKNLQFSTANIVAQFNDIGVTAAMGMSPLMIALQQGTQLSQAFAGQKTGDVVKGLGSAFAALISPTTILTLGLVAGTAALMQWGLSAIGAGKDADTFGKRLESLKESQERLTSITSDARRPTLEMIGMYGTQTNAAKALLAIQKELAQVQAMTSFDKVSTGIWETVGLPKDPSQILEMMSRVQTIQEDIARANATIMNPSMAPIHSAAISELTVLREQLMLAETYIGDASDQFSEMFAIAGEGVPGLINLFKELEGAVGFDAQGEAVIALREGLIAASGGMEQMSEQGRIFLEQLLSIEMQHKLIAAAREGEIAAGAEKLTQLKEELGIQEAIKQYGADSLYVAKLRQEAERRVFENMVNAMEIAKETKEEILETYDAIRNVERSNMAAPIAAAAGAASALAAQMNSVVDAVNAIKGALAGLQLSNVGSEARLAALKSGKSELEASFEADVAEYRNRSMAAQSIDSPDLNDEITSDFNAYVTERRRQMNTEIQIQAELDARREAARKSKGGGGGAKALNSFDDSLMREIEKLKAEKDMLDQLSGSYDSYGLSIERARKEADMLQALQNKNVELTPVVREQVKQLADDWMEVAKATEEARRKHEEFAQAVEAVRSTMESAFVGLVTGALSFKDALSQVLMKLAEMLASKAFSVLWDGYGGGNLVGSVLSAFGFGGKREMGGPVSGGKAYIVGEKRPEVFIPHTNGTIMPNTDGLRGGGNNFSFVIDARGADANVDLKIEQAIRRAAPAIENSATSKAVAATARRMQSSKEGWA